MFRIRLQVRTRYGERFMIHFHLDKDDQPKLWNFSALCGGVKSTICILYAQQHTFMDMTIGIRQETSSTTMLFPAALEEVIAEGDRILASLSQSKKCVICQ